MTESLTGQDLRAARQAVVEELFAAWSSGDLDAPRQFLAEDATLWDSVGGLHQGWEAIRSYFAHGLDRYPDLELVPTGDWWHSESGLALTWRMRATALPEEAPEASTRPRWEVPGMSHVTFGGPGGLLIVHEADYHERSARRRSLAGE